MDRPAKIRYFKHSLVHHDVLWLEVPMDYIELLQLFQSAENLVDILGDYWLWKSHIGLLFHLIKKRLAAGKFEDEINVDFVPKIPVHFEDVGVIQSRVDFDFSSDLALKSVCVKIDLIHHF